MNEIAGGYWERRCPLVRNSRLRGQDGKVAKRERRDSVAINRGHGLPVRLAADGRRATRLQCGVQWATGRSLHAGAAATGHRLMRVTGVVVLRRCRCMVTLCMLGRTGTHSRQRKVRPAQDSEHERQAGAGSDWSARNHCINATRYGPVVL